MRGRFVARVSGVLVLLALASCLGDGTGPGEMRRAHLVIAPVFDRQALRQVDVNRVLVRFIRVSDGSKAYEEVVAFPANSDTLDLSVVVPIVGDSERFDLTILMIDDPAADTVFRSGPTPITAVAGAAPATVPVPPFLYVGTGANAVGVRWVTTPGQVFFGQSVTFVAEAFDASSATIPNTPISFSSSDPSKASVPNDAVGGVVGGSTRGTVSVSASLLRTSTQSNPPSVSSTLVVQPVATAVVVQGGSGQTGPVGAPLSQPVTVRVNAADNLGVQGVTVTFAVTGGGGSISPASAVTNAAGNAAATWTLGPTPGAQSASATAAGVAGSASVGATGVVAGAAKLAFTVAPSATAIGSPITPAVQVTAQDAFGNTVPSYTGNVTIAIGANPGGASLSGTTSVAAVAGVATFSGLALSAGGNGYTLVASSAGLTGATSAAFNILGGVPTQLAFVAQPTTASVGAAIAPPVQVAIRDALGILMTSATNTVTIAIGANPGGGTLSGTVSAAAVGGIATFGTLAINAAGTGYTLSAASAGLTGATSSAFNITAGAPQTLQFTTPPANTTAGSGIASIVVTAKDAGNATATSYTGAVTLAFGANPGGATLSGTTTVNAVAGVATFPGITITKAASGYTLTATATGLSGATSGAFAIAPAAAGVLTFTQQPITTATGATLSPAVQVTAFDAFANVATAFVGNVTVAIGSNPGGATLVGTTTVAAVAGVATYSNLTLTTKGAAYTLTASSGALSTAISQTFDMTAQTLSWSNPAGGNWSNASNWSLGRVPLTTDSVIIALPGTYTVNLDTTFSASFLNVGGASGTQTLSLSSRTLTVSGALTVLPGGVFSPTGSTITGPGTVLNQGTLSLKSSTIAAGTTVDNQALTLINGTVIVNGTLVTNPAGIIRLQADGTTGQASLVSAASFTNSGAIELTSSVSTYSATVSVTSPNTLTNAAGGTITSLVGTGGARSITAQLNNQGTVTLLQPLALNPTSAAHSNSGTIDATAASFTLNQSGTTPSFTNTGTITIGAGQTWAIVNGTLNQAAGSIGGPGTLSLATVTANFTTNFSNAVTTLAVNNSTLNGPGTITNAPGQTMTIRQTTIGATSALDNQGTLVLNGSIGMSGPLTTSASSIIRLQPDGTTGQATLTSALSIVNTGTIEMTSTGSTYAATIAVTGANTLTNAAAGTITTLAGTGGGRTIDAQLNNLGTITMLQPLTLSHASAAHANSGTMDASAVDWTLSQSGTTPSFTNTGTITIGAGHTWTINNGTLNQAAGSIGGPGTLSLQAVTANFTTSFSNAVTALTVNNSTLNGPGTITNAPGQTLTIRQTTIGATSALDNQGTLVLNGSIGMNGPLTTNPSTIIRLLPDGSTGQATLTSALSIVNTGTIELTSSVSTYTAAVAVTGAGTLTNAAGATIASLVGTGGSRNINGQLNNLGTIVVLQPLTLNHASAAHSNSGTIDATAADFIVSQSGTTPSFTNTGTVTIGPGRSMTVSNGTLNQSAGTLGGPGTLALSSVTANFTTSFTNATTALVVSGSTLNGPGTVTNATGQTMSLLNVTFNADLINQGTLITDGTTTVGPANAFTNSAGATLRLQPTGSTGQSTFTAAPFTNDGLIEMTSTVSTYSATLNVSGTGVLTNSATGTIATLAGTGGPRNLGVVLDNQGMIVLNQPLTLARASSAHLNSGTIDGTLAGFTVTQSGTAPTFTNLAAGVLTIGAGQALTVNNGTFTEGGTLNGGGTLTLSSATSNLNNPFSVATLNVTGGSVAIANNLVTSALAVNLTNTVVNGPGTLTNAAGQTLSLQAVTFNTDLINQGTLITDGATTVNAANAFTAAAGSTLQLRPTGSTGNSTFTAAPFTNDGLIEMTSTVSTYAATLNVSGTGVLTNSATGTIATLVGTGGPRTLGVALNNQGTITLSQPLTLNRNGSAHSNSGLIDASAADLTMTLSTSSFVNISTGIVTIGAGRTLTVNNGTFTQSGTLNGGGILTLNGVTTNLNNPFSLAALNVTGGSVSLVPSLVTSALALSLGNTVVNGPGTLTNAAGQTLSLQAVTFNTDLINQGTLITDGATTVNAANAFTAAAGSTLQLRPTGSTGNSTFTAAPFTNDGLIEMTSTVSTYAATLNVSGTGVLTNSATGTIATLVGTGGPRTLGVVLDNQGQVILNQPLTLNRNGSAHSNSGLIDASAADLTMTLSTSSFVNISTGIVTIGAGRTLTVNNGTFTQSGTLNGGGILTLNGVTTNLNNPFTLAALNVTGGSVSLVPSLVTSALALSLGNTVVNGPGTLTNAAGQTLSLQAVTFNTDLINQGTLITDGATTVNAANAFTAAAGSTLQLRPTGSTGNSTFTAAPFTNDGLIEMTSTVSTYAATLNVSGTGVLTNSATGTIATLVGTGGPRTLGVVLDNQGQVILNQPLTLSRTGSSHSNSGLIDASLADLTTTLASSSFSNSGTITIGAGRIWTISNGTFTQEVAAALNGGGTLTSNGTALTFNTGFGLGALNVTGGSATFGTNISTGSTALGLSNTTVNGPGTITNAAGQTLSMLGGTINTAVFNQGTLISDGTSSFAAGMTASSGSILRLRPTGATGNSTLTVAGGLTNDGTIEFVSAVSAYPANLIVTGGNLVNSSSGIISTRVGTGGSRTITGNLVNNGALEYELGGTTANSQYAQLVVTGTTTLGGTLNLTLINAYTPPTTQTFDVIRSTGTLSGTVTFGTVPGGTWSQANVPGTPNILRLTAP